MLMSSIDKMKMSVRETTKFSCGDFPNNRVLSFNDQFNFRLDKVKTSNRGNELSIQFQSLDFCNVEYHQSNMMTFFLLFERQRRKEF